MTTAQRLAIRLSEIRQKLNGLSAIDEPTDEQRAELRKLTDLYPTREERHRGALVAESAEAEARGDDDPGDPGDGENRERAELRSRSRLGRFVEAAIAGRLIDGACMRSWKQPLPDGGEDDPDPNADLRRDIRNLRGDTVMVETTAAGWGESGTMAAPRADWRPQRLGAAPGAPLVDLRSESARAFLAACGCPAPLFEAGATPRAGASPGACSCMESAGAGRPSCRRAGREAGSTRAADRLRPAVRIGPARPGAGFSESHRRRHGSGPSGDAGRAGVGYWQVEL